MKKALAVCFALMLVFVVSACASDGVNGGSGKVIELDKKEAKEFQKKKTTGFLYVTSTLEVDNKNVEATKEAIQQVGKQEKVDFYLFDELKHKGYVRDLAGVNQSGLTLAFYQDGKKKEELDMALIKKESFHSEIEKFVKDAKRDYLK